MVLNNFMTVQGNVYQGAPVNIHFGKSTTKSIHCHYHKDQSNLTGHLIKINVFCKRQHLFNIESGNSIHSKLLKIVQFARSLDLVSINTCH